MKTRLFLILALLFPSLVQAQRISDLISTNLVVGTNTIPVVIFPRVTNGTFQISISNLAVSLGPYLTNSSGGYNGEVSVTNSTLIGLVYDKVGDTNRLRSVKAGYSLVLTNQGTNISFAFDPSWVNAVSNYVTAATNGLINPGLKINGWLLVTGAQTNQGKLWLEDDLAVAGSVSATDAGVATLSAGSVTVTNTTTTRSLIATNVFLAPGLGTSNYVWTLTNATTGQGEWRVAAGAGSGEANYNGETSITNSTRIGLVAGKSGVTNLLRSIQGGYGVILTNQGTNIMLAMDEANIGWINAVSNLVTAATNGLVSPGLKVNGWVLVTGAQTNQGKIWAEDDLSVNGAISGGDTTVATLSAGTAVVTNRVAIGTNLVSGTNLAVHGFTYLNGTNTINGRLYVSGAQTNFGTLAVSGVLIGGSIESPATIYGAQFGNINSGVPFTLPTTNSISVQALVDDGTGVLGFRDLSAGGGEANVNGETSVTNATKIGLVAGKSSVTNLLRSLQAGYAMGLTNEGTNVVIALTDAEAIEWSGISTNVNAFTNSPFIDKRQGGSAALTNIAGLSSTVFTNVPLGGTNISVRTTGGTNFIDTIGQLNNWSQFTTNVWNSRQGGSAALTNISGLASTVFTNVPLGGTNISVRTTGGTNFIDTIGNLNNWSQIPTGAMANVVSTTYLSNQLALVTTNLELKGTNMFLDGGVAKSFTNVFVANAGGLTNIIGTNLAIDVEYTATIFAQNGVTVDLPQYNTTNWIGGKPAIPTNAWTVIKIKRTAFTTNLWLDAFKPLDTAVAGQLTLHTNYPSGIVTFSNAITTGSGAMVLSNAPIVSNPVINGTLDGNTLLAAATFGGTVTLNGGFSAASGTFSGNLGVAGTESVATLQATNPIILLSTNANNIYLQSSQSNSTIFTNYFGKINKASASVVVIEGSGPNAAGTFVITNRITAATTLVFTNTFSGSDLYVRMIGEASGGSSRTITLIPNLGHLVANLDTFGTALATSSSFTLTNGNAVDISWKVDRMNGTNVAGVVTRQYSF